MSSHRKYGGPFPGCPWGMCRWCGLWIRDDAGNILRGKKFCTPVCETHYRLRADPQKMREHVFFRDQGKCAKCGFVHRYLNGEWEADHVIPLMIAFADPSAWEPDNVVILCADPATPERKCHYEKSAADRRLYRKKYRRKVAEILAEIED